MADANRTIEVTVCDDKRRERHLYTSAGNDVTVYVQYSSRYASFAPNAAATFILHYQGTQCGHLRRRGHVFCLGPFVGLSVRMITQ